MSFRILQGDVLERLAELAEASVHTVVTSPPYWGVRSYLPDDHPHKSKEIGRESHPAEYVARMVEVFRAVRRVLRSDGTLWLNIGDCFVTKPYGPLLVRLQASPRVRFRAPGHFGSYALPGPTEIGLKNKDLAGMPWRVALALQDDGWYLRRDNIWHKTNCSPESMSDRTTTAHEYVFHFSKSEDYFYDAEAVKEPQSENERTRRLREQERGLDTVYTIRREGEKHGQVRPGKSSITRSVAARQRIAMAGTRNRRSVWSIPAGGFRDEFCTACGAYYTNKQARALATVQLEGPSVVRLCECGRCDAWLNHFAVFPPALAEICIKAGTSARGCCSWCGSPWRRVLDRKFVGDWHVNQRLKTAGVSRCGFAAGDYEPPAMLGWKSSCGCALAGEPVPCSVLDPFGGSGTVSAAAEALGRDSIYIDLFPEYCALAEHRIRLYGAQQQQQPEPAEASA